MIARFVLSLLTAACLISCSGSGSRVEEASSSFQNGDYTRSREIVDHLAADSAALSAMSVAELCEMASLCLRIDSVSESTGGEALAVLFLGMARRQDSDSVEMYLRSLPRDAAQSLSVIDRVATYLSIPRDSLVVEGDTVQ